MKKLISTMLTLGVILAPGASLAHHSRAVYDLTKFVMITGKVTEWRWTNPHTALRLDVKDGKGQVVNWVFEGGSPSFLSRYGWLRTDIKAGDVVTVKARPYRDGTPGGSFSEINISGGKNLKGPDDVNKKPRARAEDEPL